MKRYILLLIATLIFVSCSKEEDNPKFYLEVLPVETITLPSKFKKDSTYSIPITYIRPTTCHVFDGFYYDRYLNVRTIAIQTSVLEQSNCMPAVVNPIQEFLKFKPTTENSYVFKLWKGKDKAGANIYEEIEVPVMK
jgi:hypothetical protein